MLYDGRVLIAGDGPGRRGSGEFGRLNRRGEKTKSVR